MRRFSSYGPINMKQDYYAPRKTLIDLAHSTLMGESPAEGGHYITVWAPRQCGKTWVMQEVVKKIKQAENYDVGIITMERAKEVKEEKEVLDIFIEKLQSIFERSLPAIEKFKEIPTLFTKQFFQKPVILVLDEFDALEEEFINRFASIFRDMFVSRTNEGDKKTGEKSCLLHGIALIGVRSVLGIENKTGSPFNVQRSLHIPNLDYEEAAGMFQWYEKESGQTIEPDVIAKIYDDTGGQPGLTCWFGELLTETYNKEKNRPIGMDIFERVHEAAVNLLPNSNILNIISKANEEPHKERVLKIFRTDKLFGFRFDDKSTNFLYMNGVIEPVEIGKKNYIKFACPFVQKRLFNYFSNELFGDLDRLVDPMDTLEDAVTEESLNIKNIIKRYQQYLDKNKGWLFKEAPRRKDLRIFEAVFHFNIYMYLYELIENRGGSVYPEFPTGNGKIDIMIKYNDRLYGVELKTYSDAGQYKKALIKAAEYGKQLGLTEISLVFFIESIDEENRKKYETPYLDETSGIMVTSIFVVTGD